MKKVLLRSCRCIEIDVWDGETPKSGKDSKDEKDGEEKKHRFHAHIHRPHSSTQQDTEAKSLGSTKPTTTDEEANLTLPTPWTTASTTMRAEPRVLHGHTLTKEVSFREVCAAIKDAAFVNR